MRRSSAVRIQLQQLRRRLTNQLRVMLQMAANVDRRAEGAEVFGFEGFQDLGVHMQLLSGLQYRKTLLFPACTQPRANAAASLAASLDAHDFQPGL